MHRKRIYDKKPSCFFCQKDYLKLARQYEQVHTQMRTKLNWLWNSPWNPKRENNNLLSCGKWGNFNHNMQVLENKEGKLKVHRRPTGTVTPPPPSIICHARAAMVFSGTQASQTCNIVYARWKREKPSTRQMQHDVKILLALRKSR